MNNRIVCFRHQRYEGHTAPSISCKTCCSIFVNRVKRDRENGFNMNYKKMSLKGTGLAPRENISNHRMNLLKNK